MLTKLYDLSKPYQKKNVKSPTNKASLTLHSDKALIIQE